MNLRILKKLSKRALKYLEQFQNGQELFFAQKGESYHGIIIKDHSRLERIPSCHNDVISHDTYVGTIEPKCRKGNKWPYVKLYAPSHPIKNTPMLGGMSGYYEPEWDEWTVWEAFTHWVYDHFLEYDLKTNNLVITREFRHPKEFFQAADDIVKAEELQHDNL